MNRIHDLYIASPNCTAPGFSHSQGAMYLSTGWHGPARGMDLSSRSAKLAEIWKQLCWLEAEVAKTADEGPHMVGSSLSLSDMTWFPTCVFMEFMLSPVFGWPQLFRLAARRRFPTSLRGTRPCSRPLCRYAHGYLGLLGTAGGGGAIQADHRGGDRQQGPNA